jgi:hypothetical protein
MPELEPCYIPSSIPLLTIFLDPCEQKWSILEG